jgi:hypothetical protein
VRWPKVHAYERDAAEIHITEMCPAEMHACDIYAYEACKT